MAEMPDPIPEGSGRNPREYGVGASNAAARREKPGPENEMLMEEVVESKNLMKAYRRVVGNKGAAGVDEMRVEELKPYLKTEWPKIKEQLLEDRYKPQPVRRVEIPKAGGKGMRMLGIPTVIPYCTSYSDLYECYPTMCFNLSETLILSLRSFSFSEFRVIQ